jgi:taurine transport system permease protein
VFIGVWWFAAAVVLNDPLLLPTPAATAKRAVQLAFGDVSSVSLWSDVWASLQRVLLGWGAAVVGGVSLGVAMALNRPVRWMLDPLIEFGRPIPPLAYSPLLAVWFGIGEFPKELLIFLGCVPVIVIATVSAIADVDRDWQRVALTLGASPQYVITRVIVPAALPQIWTSIRIASGLAWGMLVAAEIIASSSGLGFMILQASQFLDTATLLVGIVVIGSLAFGMDRILRAIEVRLVPWRGRAHS